MVRVGSARIDENGKLKGGTAWRPDRAGSGD